MKQKKIKNIIYFICIIIFILSIIYIVNYLLNLEKTKVELAKIRKIMESKENVVESINNTMEKDEINYKIEQLKKVREQNSEIVAWLKIEGTEINHPVLQTNNNEYYLTRNYKKEYDSNGSIFLDCRYDFERPSDNFLIYGHNNSLMFEKLLDYQDKNYYETHPTINLTTLEEDATYKIIAVFKGQAYSNLENEFLYYNYVDFRTDDEYYNYISNCVKKSLYKINYTINYRQKLLTLSTCEYSKKNGRFAILAIKIEDNYVLY